MTVDQFFDRIVDTYCPRDPAKRIDSFPPAVQTDVRAWLSKQREGMLGIIWAELVKSVSRAYKTAPGIYELEQAKKAAIVRVDSEPHPALLPDADTPLLLEDASPMRDEQVAKGFDALMAAMKRGRNPVQDETVTSVLHELGYEQ